MTGAPLSPQGRGPGLCCCAPSGRVWFIGWPFGALFRPIGLAALTDVINAPIPRTNLSAHCLLHKKPRSILAKSNRAPRHARLPRGDLPQPRRARRHHWWSRRSCSSSLPVLPHADGVRFSSTIERRFISLGQDPRSCSRRVRMAKRIWRFLCKPWIPTSPPAIHWQSRGTPQKGIVSG